MERRWKLLIDLEKLRRLEAQRLKVNGKLIPGGTGLKSTFKSKDMKAKKKDARTATAKELTADIAKQKKLIVSNSQSKSMFDVAEYSLDLYDSSDEIGSREFYMTVLTATPGYGTMKSPALFDAISREFIGKTAYNKWKSKHSGIRRGYKGNSKKVKEAQQKVFHKQLLAQQKKVKPIDDEWKGPVPKLSVYVIIKDHILRKSLAAYMAAPKEVTGLQQQDTGKPLADYYKLMDAYEEKVQSKDEGAKVQKVNAILREMYNKHTNEKDRNGVAKTSDMNILSTILTQPGGLLNYAASIAQAQGKKPGVDAVWDINAGVKAWKKIYDEGFESMVKGNFRDFADQFYDSVQYHNALAAYKRLHDTVGHDSVQNLINADTKFKGYVKARRDYVDEYHFNADALFADDGLYDFYEDYAQYDALDDQGATGEYFEYDNGYVEQGFDGYDNGYGGYAFQVQPSVQPQPAQGYALQEMLLVLLILVLFVCVACTFLVGIGGAITCFLFGRRRAQKEKEDKDVMMEVEV